MKMMEEEKTSYFQRYRQIISILVKYGFEDLVAHTRFKTWDWSKMLPDRNGVPAMEYSRYERIRLVCEELGTTFIKFAQILSNRPDIFPDALIVELEKMQDKVPAVPFKDLQGKLERDYGLSLSEIFEEVNETPLASASIAQVHQVRLKGGQKAVLKIQKPGIRKNVTADIEIMRDLAGILERNFPETAIFQPVELVHTFEKAIRRELNFKTEATSMKRFAKNFEGQSDIYVPKVFDQWTNEKVICQEFVEGCKLTDIAGIEKTGLSRIDAAKLGLDLYFRQVFDFGFFHADPHPGNIFVLPDKRLCFIDFGMMGNLNRPDQYILGDLMFYIYVQDVKKLADTIRKMAVQKSIQNQDAFERELQDFLDQAHVTSISEVEMKDILNGLRKVMYEYKITIPSQFHLLMRALIIIEGVGLYLYPEYNLMEEIQPYARELMARKFSPRELFKMFKNNAEEAFLLAANLPGDIREIVTKVKQGRLHIEIEHKGYSNMLDRLDIISNRLAFAIIAASMIIGSAIVIHSDIPPHYKNIPVIGIVTFILAGLFAIKLLLAILKRGKL